MFTSEEDKSIRKYGKQEEDGDGEQHERATYFLASNKCSSDILVVLSIVPT